jgi:hypothetical protein
MNIYFLADVSAGTLAVIYVVIFIIPAFLGVCWMPSLSSGNQSAELARRLHRNKLSREWTAKNRAKSRAMKKKWRDSNKSKHRALTAAWLKKNREKIKTAASHASNGM